MRFAKQLACVALFAVASHAESQTFLRVVSDEGDFVGLGRTWIYDEGAGDYSIHRNRHNGVTLFFRGAERWSLEFSAPREARLLRGPYEDAFDFITKSPTKPGLTVRGPGYPCRPTAGRFEILEVSYGPSSEIERFAAKFEQRCEGFAPGLRGQVRFNASGRFGKPIDSDRDRIPDTLDNCVWDKNYGQRDRDRDTIGDACDDAFTNSFLFMESPTGDFIGDGKTYFLDLLEGDIIARKEDVSNRVFVVFDGDVDWILRFSAHGAALLEPGVYERAGSYDFPELRFPEIDIGGDGRGCGSQTGRFQILEAVFGDDGVVERFAADFSQRCGGFGAPLVGSIRVNASNELGTLSDDDGDDVIDFVDVCPGQFNPAQRDVDADGIGDLCDETSQASFVLSASEPLDPIGEGRRTLFTTEDRFHIRPNRDNGIRFTVFTDETSHMLNFSAPHDEPLAVGAYEGATLYPFQADDVPGLNVFNDGSVCETTLGRFDVHEIEYGPDGRVDRLAIDFEQRCTGEPAALLGSVRFRAAVQTTATDQDGDAILDADDNCVGAFNPWQLDTDGDGIGAACTPCSAEPPRLRSLGPTRGRPGRRVKVNVANLAPEVEVWFGSERAEIVARNRRRLVVLVPAAAVGTVPVRISSPSGCPVVDRARPFFVKR